MVFGVLILHFSVPAWVPLAPSIPVSYTDLAWDSLELEKSEEIGNGPEFVWDRLGKLDEGSLFVREVETCTQNV